MENFTPISGLMGGILIGAASVLLLIANGRIAGISGIVGGLLTPRAGELAWRALFVLGLVLGGIVWQLGSARPLPLDFQASTPVMIIAGLLVGFGTRLGSGCTSGHGICGISRLSARSIAATLVFMASGVITVFIARHVLGG